jgi:hypothetical protein
MAFDMAAVPAIGQLDIIDITPPVAVGDQRTEVSFSAPPYDRYIRAVAMSAIRGRLIGELPEAVPYVGPCQIEIPECPECGRRTTRMVRGATIKAYLQRYGVTKQQAKQLWQMRQLTYGWSLTTAFRRRAAGFLTAMCRSSLVGLVVGHVRMLRTNTDTAGAHCHRGQPVASSWR